MRYLTERECKQVGAGGFLPTVNDDNNLVMSPSWGLGAVGGMIGAALYEWKGLILGFAIGAISWPVGKEVFQGFPHLKKWFGSKSTSEEPSE